MGKPHDIDLSVEFAGVKMRAPIGVAAQAPFAPASISGQKLAEMLLKHVEAGAGYVHTPYTNVELFEDVEVPAENLLGSEGLGFKLSMETLDKARPTTGAMALGVAQAALEAAVNYAKERVQFGRPIAQQQAVQMMLADMAMKVETARLLVYKVGYLMVSGLPFTQESAMSKCYAADIAMEVATDAVQIFGGYGYTRDYPVEKYMRDAKIMQTYEGTNQIQRIVIAKELVHS